MPVKHLYFGRRMRLTQLVFTFRIALCYRIQRHFSFIGNSSCSFIYWFHTLSVSVCLNFWIFATFCQTERKVGNISPLLLGFVLSNGILISWNALLSTELYASLASILLFNELLCLLSGGRWKTENYQPRWKVVSFFSAQIYPSYYCKQDQVTQWPIKVAFPFLECKEMVGMGG